MRFAGPTPDSIRIERLGVLTACYHRPSGRTHLLTEPAPEILTLIAGRTLSRSDILGELTRQYDLAEEDGVMEEALAARLDELVEAGLAVTVREDEVGTDA